MKRLLTLISISISFCILLQAQSDSHLPITYYLPDIEYDPNIPTPESFFGFQIGEWHLTHDKQYTYMRELARLSDRITLTEYARSYEQRPLVYLTITSPANHARLAELKAQHQQLSDPDRSGTLDPAKMPVVLYQGFSIHGNEPSGANAAPLVAYYLAAGKSAELDKLLNEAIIIFDPSFNPDGLNRFASWVNEHKNKNLTSDPSDREYNEPWPRGRTNHYWFDLNRDWLPAQHPESRGRVELFQDWRPNVLTDHHEMGSNSSFFFMPGESTRVNPLTPAINQELTGKIADFHAEALDKIGSLYYSGEGYDDFYYGKGSTYPDVQGCIGILFEQASSRGHLQDTDNGPLSFAFTIRNQVTTALSTHKAILALRQQLLSYQRDYYRDVQQEAKSDARGAFIFGDPKDFNRTNHLVEILRRQHIRVHKLGKSIKADNSQAFEPGSAYIVPLEQPHYRLIRAMFETQTTFEDSLFYDISSWTLPLAFDLPYGALSKRSLVAGTLGAEVTGLTDQRNLAPVSRSGYAYLIDWNDYYGPKAVNYLLTKGLRAKSAMETFTLNGKSYDRGTVMVPAVNQPVDPEMVFQYMQEAQDFAGVQITAVGTGFSPQGIDLGSNSFRPLDKPRICLVIGDGVSSADAGETWHLLDQRYDIPVTKIEADQMGRTDIWKYNVIILPSGSYNGFSNGTLEDLKRWTRDGGTLILSGSAVQWAAGKGLANVAVRKTDSGNEKGRKAYDGLRDDFGSRSIPGSIFQVQTDLTNPLFFGRQREMMPVFRNDNLLFEPAQNPYATPAVYTASPLLSGYIPNKLISKVAGSAEVIVSGMGRGRAICLADNLNFRAFWYGTNRLFINSIFLGSTISGGATETQAPKQDDKK